MGRVIAEFAALYPEVRVDMQVSNRVVDLVEEGVDVALRVRQTLEDSGSLVVKTIGRTDGVLVCAPAQIARQGRPQAVEDLHRMDTLAMGMVDGRASWRPRFVADDLLTLKTAVLQGIGMVTIPAYLCCDSLANGRLVNAGDAAELPRMLNAVEANLGQRPEQALADTGHRSEAVFQALVDGPTELVVALGREGKQQLKFDPTRNPRTAEMAAKLQSDEGQAADRKRKWIAEPPNGWIKNVLGLRQFSMRGLRWTIA